MTGSTARAPLVIGLARSLFSAVELSPANLITQSETKQRQYEVRTPRPRPLPAPFRCPPRTLLQQTPRKPLRHPSVYLTASRWKLSPHFKTPFALSPVDCRRPLSLSPRSASNTTLRGPIWLNPVPLALWVYFAVLVKGYLLRPSGDTLRVPTANTLLPHVVPLPTAANAARFGCHQTQLLPPGFLPDVSMAVLDRTPLPAQNLTSGPRPLDQAPTK